MVRRGVCRERGAGAGAGSTEPEPGARGASDGGCRSRAEVVRKTAELQPAERSPQPRAGTKHGAAWGACGSYRHPPLPSCTTETRCDGLVQASVGEAGSHRGCTTTLDHHIQSLLVATALL